ncbi:MAG: hypothetical protein L0216_08545 [Planctomycetales bacterium]|nr:hypothetical protein [Planctomycetales bacterium]
MAEANAIREVLQRWVDRVLPDVRVKALWLEGETPRALRDPRPPLDLHAAAEEPDFAAVFTGHEALLAAAGPVEAHRDGPAAPDARECRARIRGLGEVVLTVERMSLLAKRPRAAVTPLVDRSGKLRFVLDYSRRSR